MVTLTKKCYNIIVLILLLMVPFVFGVQPTQQYNKIYLSPFYRTSMSQNYYYNYTVIINPSDKVGGVLSAIISMDVYLTPTVNFSILVNGRVCNTPSFIVSTTYASAGQGRITFDCSNIMRSAGVYNVSIRPTQANTGASTIWLDLTYMNSPQGSADIFGTEYAPNDNGTVFLQLLDNQKNPVNNSLCYIDMYSPAKAKILDNVMMTYLLDSKGLYYYDFIVSNIIGVYMVSANCFYYYNLTYLTASKDTHIRSTANTTNYGNETYFSVGKASSMNLVGFLEFNLSNISSPSEIEEVWLYLYGISSLSSPEINIFRVTSAWNESNVTWINAPTINTNVYDTKRTTVGWNLWNITLLAKSWLNGTFVNYGMMLNFTPSVASFNFTSFSSKENSAELSPRLLVKYKALQQIDTIRGSGEVHVSASSCPLTESDIWNYSNRSLTFYPEQVDLFNYSRVGNLTAFDVWTYITRNLTFYPLQVDLTDYNLVSQRVWNYVARYTHGVILN